MHKENQNIFKIMTTLSNDLLQKIARNINAMELADDPRNYKYWRSVYARIVRVTRQLTEADKVALLPLCIPVKAKAFNLI